MRERVVMAYLPANEGVDHINAYSKSRLLLGRTLSNFAHTPFTLVEDGTFASIEAYWYWLSVPAPQNERLRPLYGFEAKRTGRGLRGADWPTTPTFRYKVCSALYAKVVQTPTLAEALASSVLPITHYYVVDGRVIEPEGGGWVWEYYEAIRDAYHERAQA